MFNGFTKKTLVFFNEIKHNNSKLYFNEHRNEYNLYVKEPLIQLFNRLIEPLTEFDSQIEHRLQKCMSSPYADARFCREKPIKEYMYLRFKLARDRETDIPGFYFDASAGLIRYGIKIYNTTSNGMQKIRDYIMNNRRPFQRAVQKIENLPEITIGGNPFKKDHYPAIDEPLKKWLNFRDINLFCTLRDYDLFFKADLAGIIAETFDCLKPLFRIIKINEPPCRSGSYTGQG
jgi:uncharacterized protein (TIGR02453 family)